MSVAIDYSINQIKDEARYLVEAGKVECHQPIYVLCQFIPPREWICAECELEDHDYLLRDRIRDLLPEDEWRED